MAKIQNKHTSLQKIKQLMVNLEENKDHTSFLREKHKKCIYLYLLSAKRDN
jgi:hypothetical protein